MTQFQTPYGTVDAPSEAAAQKWIAKQKGAGAATPSGEQPSPWHQLWEGLKRDVTQIPEVARAKAPQMGRDIAEGVTGLGRDLGQSLNPLGNRQQNAAAGGRVLGKIGDVAAFLSGGGGLTMPPAAEPVEAPPVTAAQGLLRDFRSQGVRPSIPVIGQGRGMGVAAQAGRLLPASPVGRGIQGSLQDTQQAVEGMASRFGGAENPEQAGGIIQRAVRNYGEDRSQAALDYGEFDRLMHGAAPAPVGNTLKALNDLYAKFVNNPELDQIFNDPKLARLRQAVEPHTISVPQQTSSIMGPTGQPIVTRAAQTIQRGGVLPVQDLKLLRTRIGYMLERPTFGPEEIPKADLSRVYKSLTKDLYSAAQQRSPQAAHALARASGNYQLRMSTMERLEKTLGKPDEVGVAPQRFFNRLNTAAQQGSGENAGLLMRVRQIMPPGDWQNVGAAAIRRLGVPTAGTRDILGDNFSVTSFATNWNKLSPRAKDLLFGSDLPNTPRAGLEQLSRIAQAQKNVGKLANTSHSAEMLGTLRLVEGVLTAVAMGHFPWATTMGLTGAYGASKLLMSPGFTNWLYQLPRMAVPRTGAIPEGGLINAGTALQQALSNPQAGTPPPAQLRQNVGDTGPNGGRIVARTSQ